MGWTGFVAATATTAGIGERRDKNLITLRLNDEI